MSANQPAAKKTKSEKVETEESRRDRKRAKDTDIVFRKLREKMRCVLKHEVGSEKNIVAQIDLELFMTATLNSPVYTARDKIGLLYVVGSLSRVASEWGYRNLEGGELDRHAHTFYMGEEEAAAVAENENVTWSILMAMFRYHWGVQDDDYSASSPRGIYVTQMNDVSAHLLLGRLIRDQPRVGGNESLMLARARRLYGVDESIPDEWVKRMLS